MKFNDPQLLERELEYRAAEAKTAEDERRRLWYTLPLTVIVLIGFYASMFFGIRHLARNHGTGTSMLLVVGVLVALITFNVLTGRGTC